MSSQMYSGRYAPKPVRLLRPKNGQKPGKSLTENGHFKQSNNMENFSTPLVIDIDKMNSHIGDMVTEIDAELKAIDDRSRKLRQAKQSLQEVCYHQYEADGHDHSGHYEKCKFCGKSQRN